MKVYINLKVLNDYDSRSLYNLLLIYGIYNLKYYPLNVILELYTN